MVVNPRERQILGQAVYPSLGVLPGRPDRIDVFRRNKNLPGVADDAVALGPYVLWIQVGRWNEAAAARPHGAGLGVVMNRGLKIEHVRFHGGPSGGFRHPVISARRSM